MRPRHRLTYIVWLVYSVLGFLYEGLDRIFPSFLTRCTTFIVRPNLGSSLFAIILVFQIDTNKHFWNRFSWREPHFFFCNKIIWRVFVSVRLFVQFLSSKTYSRRPTFWTATTIWKLLLIIMGVSNRQVEVNNDYKYSKLILYRSKYSSCDWYRMCQLQSWLWRKIFFLRYVLWTWVELLNLICVN